MDSKLVILILVITLTGAAALGVAWTLSSPSEPSSATSDASAEEIAALRKQLVAMDARIRQLERDVDGLDRDRSASSPSAAVAPSRAEPRGDAPARVTRTEGEVENLLDPAVEPEVREKVQEMVRDELEIERQERQIRRTERMKERAREEAEEFADEVGLEGTTKQRFTERMVAEREKMMNIWREARDNDTDRDEVRAQMEAIRGQTDKEMAAMLNDTQYAAFAEERAEEAERFQRRGRGRRGR